MTSRELTGLLSLDEAAPPSQISDFLWRMGFGFIGWPWLVRSLSGGRRVEKYALLDMLGLPHDALPHLGSWKADMGFLRHIVAQIARLRPQTVVELGAGASTLITARALALHGGGRLVSFDQHRDFAEATGAWLHDHGLSAEVRHAPLSADPDQWPGRWYALDDVPERIDMLVIDGPPWSVHPLVRGAADSLFARLSPGGVVLLDDAARPGERLVARQWRRRWPDMHFTLLRDGTKGTLIGVKQDPKTARTLAALAAHDDRGRLIRRSVAGVAALAMLGAGWLAHDVMTDLPASTFVDEAAASHKTALLRQAMVSQVETPRLDRAEILRSTGIRLPALPTNWRVLDVQLYPAANGSWVAISLVTGHGEPVSLLAGRAETPAGKNPIVTRRADEAVAYWEEGDLAFAVTGSVAPERALRLAAMVAGR